MSSVVDKPTTYVLAVGVSDFEHLPSEKDLWYAEADATAFTQGLSASLREQLPPDQVTLLVGSNATLERVGAALRETLGAADENDTVILFFSTHGEVEGDEGYLYTWDSTPDDRLPYTSLPTRDIVNAVNRSRAAHVLLFTDACHAGITGAGTKGTGVPTFDPSKIQVDHRSFFNQASSTIRQESLEGAEYCGGHGAYTCALLMAMQGAVDHDDDGVVTLRELQIHLPPIVDAITGGKQSPETKGRYDSKHVFANVIPEYSVGSSHGEYGIKFAKVAPDQIEVMEVSEEESVRAPSPVVELFVPSNSDEPLPSEIAMYHKVATEPSPIDEPYDTPDGVDHSTVEITIAEEAAAASEESKQESSVPMAVEDEPPIPRLNLYDNPYDIAEGDETIFVAYPDLLLSQPDLEETQSPSNAALDGGEQSPPQIKPADDEPLPVSANNSTLDPDLLDLKHLRTKLALFAIPLAAGATYNRIVVNPDNEPITWVSATALVTFTEYTAIMGLRTCRLIVNEWPKPRNDRSSLRCQLGVTTVAIGSVGSALSLMAGGAIIVEEFTRGSSQDYFEYAIYTGIGAAAATSTSILLSTGQHLNNARLIPGVSTPGTSSLLADPAQPMWAQAGWSPMGLTVVGTF